MRVLVIGLVAMGLSAFAAATAAPPSRGDLLARFDPPPVRDGFVRREVHAAPNDSFADLVYRERSGIVLEIGFVEILDMSPKEHFWARRAAFLRDKPDAVMLVEGDYLLEGKTTERGYWGKYRFGEAAGRRTGAVITFDFGKWDVHIRAEYPLRDARAAEHRIRRFLRSLAWDRLR